MRDERGLKVLASPPRVLRGNREHRWRCVNAHVSVVNGARPFDGIAHPDARRLRPRPKLEVLGPIVVAHAVDVVNRLPADQAPPEEVLSYQDVFKDVGTSSRPRMTGDPHHHVASLVSGTTSLPISIGLTGLSPASSARRRLDLFGATASTPIPTTTGWTSDVPARRPKDSAAFLAPLVSHHRTATKGCDDGSPLLSTRTRSSYWSLARLSAENRRPPDLPPSLEIH